MFFLYHNRSFRTGRVLARTLGLTFARNSSRVPANTDVLIRWGNAQPTPVAIGQEINSARAISNASDKLRTFELLRGAGVSIPQVEQYSDNFGGGTVYFGRSRRGFGGRDIVVYEGLREYPFQAHDFFTKYIEPHFEARIHVAFGEVIRVQKKYLDYPDHRSSEYIRNYTNGYRFRTPQQGLNNSRLEAAKAAVEACGLDFGAVDLLVGTDGNEYVLEVNTAPKCSPLTGRAYVDAFVRRLGSGGPDYDQLQALNAET